MSKEEADTAAQVEDDEEEDDGVEESPEQAAAVRSLVNWLLLGCLCPP